MTDDSSTVIVDQYRAAASKAANRNAYKGLAIHALPGLHDFLASHVAQHVVPGATLLDLAAGSGAMSLRLHDMGFRVTATDYVTENFRPSSITFQQADLNERFASNYPAHFQAIVASEIIEHLENPRNFARECFKLLMPGGRLILSTPNVENPASKASFLRSGSFLWFSDEDYRVQGHITPLTQWQIDKAFTEVGFTFLAKSSFGDGASRTAGSPRLRVLARLVDRLSSTDRLLRGEIYVVVLGKPLAPAG